MNGSKSANVMDQSKRKVRPQKDRITGRPHKGVRMLRDPKGVQLRKVRRPRGRHLKVKPLKGPVHTGHKRGPQTRKGDPDGKAARRGEASYAVATAACIPCHHALYVMGEEGSQTPITRLEFTNISTYLTVEWMRLLLDEQVKIQVRKSRWQNGRGIFLCEDEDTKRWVKASVEKCRDKQGARFRAFGRDELRSEQAMIKLSNAQVAAGYEKVLQTAISGLKLRPSDIHAPRQIQAEGWRPAMQADAWFVLDGGDQS